MEIETQKPEEFFRLESNETKDCLLVRVIWLVWMGIILGCYVYSCVPIDPPNTIGRTPEADIRLGD